MIKLPEKLILRGSLDFRGTEFGDEFLNSPLSLGQRPPPGRTFLHGWIEIKFDPPEDDWASFQFDLDAVGSHETLEWGSGQNFLMTGNRMCRLTNLPGGMEAENKGRLNLRTGEVDPASLRISLAFRNSLIAEVGALNRLPFAFPFFYPTPPWPPVIIDQFTESPEQAGPEFAVVQFKTNTNGEICGLQLSAETNVPVSIFPALGLFPDFSFGNNNGFYFGLPTHWEQDTPEDKRITRVTNPDGILLAPPAYFHPHLNILSDDLAPTVEAVSTSSETEAQSGATLCSNISEVFVLGGIDPVTSAPSNVAQKVQFDVCAKLPNLPLGVTNAASVTYEDMVFVLGGMDESGHPTDAFQIYDSNTEIWSKGPSLPVAVHKVSAVVCDGLIYVIGGISWPQVDQILHERLQIFDPLKRTWELGQSMPLPVSDPGLAVVDDEIWVVNGMTEKGTPTSRVSVYTPKTQRWRIEGRTEHETSQSTVMVVGEHIFRVGGLIQADRPTHSVEIYDQARKRWSPGFDVPRVILRGTAVSTTSGGFVIGYEPEAQVATSPQVYDVSRGWVVHSKAGFSSRDISAGNTGVASDHHLSPGLRARLISNDLGIDVKCSDVRIFVGDYPVDILHQTDRMIEFVVPDLPVPNSEEIVLTVQIDGCSRSTTVPLKTVVPTLFLLGNDITQDDPWVYRETKYLSFGSVLAANEDETLNFPEQSALVGETVTLFATGLSCVETVQIELSNLLLPTHALVTKSDKFDGVQLVKFRIPEDVTASPGRLHSLRVFNGNLVSNPVTISVSKQRSDAARKIPINRGTLHVFGSTGR